MIPSAQPPRILPSDRADEPRPFWSVMIPTYQPREEFLRETLAAVLQQDRGPAQMQIEVVDDCSPDIEVRALVQRIAGSRVQFRQTERNLGLAGCWNACIEHARGEWVHVLHQDDLLYPGFYAELEELAAAHTSAGAVFTRHAFADALGHWHWISALERPTSGLLEYWADRIASEQRLQCVSIAVRRACYEKLGGFRSDLAYVLDWEMWARLAQHTAFAYSPRVLAAYRQHGDSATALIHRERRTLADHFHGFACILTSVPEARRAAVSEEFFRHHAQRVWDQADSLFRANAPADATALLRQNWRYIPIYRRTDFRFLYLRCLIKKIKLRLAH